MTTLPKLTLASRVEPRPVHNQISNRPDSDPRTLDSQHRRITLGVPTDALDGTLPAPPIPARHEYPHHVEASVMGATCDHHFASLYPSMRFVGLGCAIRPAEAEKQNMRYSVKRQDKVGC